MCLRGRSLRIRDRAFSSLAKFPKSDLSDGSCKRRELLTKDARTRHEFLPESEGMPMNPHRFLLSFAILPMFACSSVAGPAASDPTQAGASGTGGAGSGTGTGGDSAGDLGPVACSLPPSGSAGVPRPTGSAANLEVLDWAGFAAAVSYTFDDANSSQISHYSEIQALGVPMTFYLQTGKSSASDAIWAQALLDGHELGNHTKTHPQSGTDAEVDDATDFIKEHFGVTPYTMAAPYGDMSYVSLAESRFLLNRGVSGGRISPNGSSNPFNLPCHIPAAGADAAALNSVIDATQTAGAWQIVLVHGFTGGSDGAYQPIAIEEFVANVEHAKSLANVWIDSAVDVGAYWAGQKLFTQLEPVDSGDASTWSWTLPENFPPGKCLRVRVDGGTLSQSGEPLSWDDHGYYQVALDSGSLTLSP